MIMLTKCQKVSVKIKIVINLQLLMIKITATIIILNSDPRHPPRVEGQISFKKDKRI